MLIRTLAILAACLAAVAVSAEPPHAARRTAAADSRRLLATVGRGDVAATAALLLRGANPNVTDPDGRTPLMYASMAGKADLVTLLLKHGAKVNQRESAGFTELMGAMIGRSPAVARLLVAHGADVSLRNKAGGSALSLVMASHDTATARLLLNHGFPVDSTAAGGETPLYQAAQAGDDPFIRLFLEKRASLEAPTNDGWTPLMAAASEGRASAVRMLLQKSAKANAAGQEGETPLMLAAAAGSLETVKLLLDSGSKVNATDTQGRTPLMRACSSPEQAVVDLLLAHGADPKAADKSGGTALMRAAARGNAGAVRALLAAGADPKAADRQGLTALTRAAALGNTSVVAALRDAGVNEDADGRGARAARIRAAVTAGLPLIENSANTFTERTGGACFSCHHHAITAFAVRTAKDAGYAVSHTWFKQQRPTVVKGVDGPSRQIAGALKDPKALAEMRKQDRDAGINFGYGLLAFEMHEMPASAATDRIAAYLLLRQERDGGWTGPGMEMRRPAEHSAFTSTALAIRSLKQYAPKSKAGEVAKSFEAARKWLASAPAKTTEDKTFRLFGLVWCGGNAADDDVKAAVRELLSDQRLDGGWAQETQLAPDAYATGEALLALHDAGMAAENAAWSRGVDFLLRTQEEDGSWLVKSRAIPIQGYINSGFPHGRSQYISISGTCWATAALSLAGSPTRTARR